MGQKVHPLIFRSKLFPVYKNYYNIFDTKNNLKKNYLINYTTLYKKLSFLNILNIYCKITYNQSYLYYIILSSEKQYFKYKEHIFNLINKTNLNINFYVFKHPFISSSFILNYIISQYKLNKISLRKLIKQVVIIILNKYRIKGIQFLISGRLNGVQMAKTEKFNFNKTSLHKLKYYIDYSSVQLNTKYGTIGFKVWIFF